MHDDSFRVNIAELLDAVRALAPERKTPFQSGPLAAAARDAFSGDR